MFREKIVSNVTLKVTWLYFQQRTSNRCSMSTLKSSSLCKYIWWISGIRLLSDAWAAQKLLLLGWMWSRWMSDYSQGGNKDNWNSSWGNYSRTYGCWWTRWLKLRPLSSLFCFGAVALIVKLCSALPSAAAKQYCIHILHSSKCASAAKTKWGSCSLITINLRQLRD